MARFRHPVLLTPLTRPWLDRAVGLAHEVLTEQLGGPDLPLVDGEPLAPGATYRSPEDGTTVRLDAYGYDSETEGYVEVIRDDAATGVNVRLGRASAPDVLEFAGRVEMLGGPLSSSDITYAAQVDLDRWGAGDEAAVTGWLRHRIGRGSADATCARAGDGRWRVTVRLTVGGVGLLRPIMFLVLLFTRVAVRQEMVRVLTAFARAWNERVPTLVALSEDELRAELRELLRASLLVGPGSR